MPERISAVLFLVIYCANRYPKISKKRQFWEKNKKNVKKCFKNLHISKKSIIFASNFSNLWYVKYDFMNNKKQYCKYVYQQRVAGDNFSYYRKGTSINDDCRLYREFPLVAKVVSELRGYIEYDNLKAWIDKHGNVIVRTFHEDKQTKIDF